MRCIKNTVHIKSCMKNQNLKKLFLQNFLFQISPCANTSYYFHLKKLFAKISAFHCGKWQLFTQGLNNQGIVVSLSHTCTLVIAKNIYLWSVGTTGSQCTKLVHSTLKLLWMKYYNSPILSLYDCVNESLTLKILKVNKHKPQPADYKHGS